MLIFTDNLCRNCKMPIIIIFLSCCYIYIILKIFFYLFLCLYTNKIENNIAENIISLLKMQKENFNLLIIKFLFVAIILPLIRRTRKYLIVLYFVDKIY